MSIIDVAGVKCVKLSAMGADSRKLAEQGLAAYQNRGDVLIFAKPLQGCADMAYSHRIASFTIRESDKAERNGWIIIAAGL